MSVIYITVYIQVKIYTTTTFDVVAIHKIQVLILSYFSYISSRNVSDVDIIYLRFGLVEKWMNEWMQMQ